MKVPFTVFELAGAANQPMDIYHRDLMQWAAKEITRLKGGIVMVDENETDDVTALLKRVDALEKKLAEQDAVLAEFKAGIERMATYQGVLHVLKGQ